jgi:NAD(P)H-dependent FMN reductase
MNDRLNIGLVYGSTRPGRFCDTVAEWLVERVGGSARLQLHRLDPARWTASSS